MLFNDVGDVAIVVVVVAAAAAADDDDDDDKTHVIIKVEIIHGVYFWTKKHTDLSTRPKRRLYGSHHV